MFIGNRSTRDVERRLLYLEIRDRKGNLNSENGFTLVEMLVVLIILPLIIGAISLAIVAIFTQQSNVTGRLSGSTDLQMIDATYVRDVESASTFTNQSAPRECGSAGTQILGMKWSSDQTAVSYVIVPGNGSGSAGYDAQLQRLYCTNNSPTATSVMVVSTGVSSGIQQPPTICTGNIPKSGTCTPSPTYPVSAANVTEVLFKVYVPKSTTPFVLVAAPRHGAPGNLIGGPITSTPIVLTSTDCGTVLTLNNGGQLWINQGGQHGNGAITIESPCAKTLAVNKGPQGAICVSAIISGSTPLGSFSNPKNNNPCAQYDPSNPPPLSPPWYYHKVFKDPLASLQPPPLPQGQGTCNVTVANKTNDYSYTCTPGSYSQNWTGTLPKDLKSGGSFSFPRGQFPVIVNNATIVFAAGPYSFSEPVALPNGVNATFGDGTYSFLSAGNAFSVTSNNSLSSVTGNGVLFYAPSGSITFGNNTVVNLTPNTDPQFSQYGLSIWAGPPVSSSSCPNVPPIPSPFPYIVALANNSSDAYGGIYAPCAEIESNSNGTLTTSFIVASSASFSPGTIINVTTP